MRSVEQIWSSYASYTKATSDVARQLALAGIAIVWAFKAGTTVSFGIDRVMLGAALMCIVALGADFLQYVLGSLLYESVGNRWEQEGKFEGEIDASAIQPMTRCFWTKIVAVFLAYELIAAHMIGF